MVAAFLALMLAQAQPMADAGPPCVLHVWGAGRPNFKLPERLLRQQDPAMMDRSNPLATANLFDTVQRASALPDEELQKLLPHAGRVTIVRHDAVIDTDKTPLDKLVGPLAPASGECYADLIVANLYALFPNGVAAWQQAGVVGALLAGGDRLVVDFRFRDFSTPVAAGKTYRKKNDTPLPHVPFGTPEMKAGLETSAVANLRTFVTYVDRQRGH